MPYPARSALTALRPDLVAGSSPRWDNAGFSASSALPEGTRLAADARSRVERASATPWPDNELIGAHAVGNWEWRAAQAPGFVAEAATSAFAWGVFSAAALRALSQSARNWVMPLSVSG